MTKTVFLIALGSSLLYLGRHMASENACYLKATENCLMVQGPPVWERLQSS